MFRFLIFCITITQSFGSTCDLTSSPSSWATIHAQNVFFNAWQPDAYLASFCINNDFFTHSLNYSAHVNLADPTATVQHDVATAQDLDSSKTNCGKTHSEVVWCQSHCQDKNMEELIISASITNGSLPLDVSKKIYQTLSSPVDMAIAAVQIDQNIADIHVDYDYYNDNNFCSVYLKIKRSLMFPYVLLVTSQKVIV